MTADMANPVSASGLAATLKIVQDHAGRATLSDHGSNDEVAKDAGAR